MQKYPTIFAGLILLLLISACAQAGDNTVVIVDTTSRCVLETVRNGQWQGMRGIMAEKHLPKRYRLFKNGRSIKSVNASAPVAEKVPGDDSPVYRVNFSETVEPGQIAIGNLNWDPCPRKAVKLNTQDSTYQEAVRKLLDKKGLTASKINITHIYRVDLEGDGVDEVFINTNYIQTKKGDPKLHRKDIHNRYQYATDGDYSFILLRRIVNGSLVSDLLSGNFHPPRSELEQVTIPAPPPATYSIAAIMDLNGDGRMEYVTQMEEFERRAIYMVEMTPDNRFISHPAIYLSTIPGG